MRRQGMSLLLVLASVMAARGQLPHSDDGPLDAAYAPSLSRAATTCPARPAGDTLASIVQSLSLEHETKNFELLRLVEHIKQRHLLNR